MNSTTFAMQILYCVNAMSMTCTRFHFWWSTIKT